MYLQFQPIGAKGLTRHLSGEDGFLCRTHSTGVWQQLYIGVLCNVCQQVILLVFQLHSLHSDSYHLRFTRFDCVSHQGIVIKFSCSKKQT